MKIRKLMRENPIAVRPEMPLRDVATIVIENGFSGLPVTGERLEVLGVVSEADILVKELPSGPPERRSDAERLERFVARVPGVVRVHSTLRGGWDDRSESSEVAEAVGKR